VLAAARGLGAGADVGLLSVRSAGEWTACLPVKRYSRWHRIPLPCLATWRHSYCLLGTPLLAAEDASASALALLDGMRGAGRVAFAALAWVPADGPVGQALSEAPVTGIDFERISRATLIRRPQDDYLEGRVKGKHRREFRRMARALEEELGGELELVDRSEDAAAVEAFLELEASGWKGREGTALASNPAHAEFFREVSRAFVARGELELLFLQRGERIAAARYSLIAGGASFCFKVAYDEELSRSSPGRELELRLIDRFHEQGQLRWMDSCADSGNDLFDRLWPDRRDLLTQAFPAPGPLGTLAKGALRGAAAVRKRRAGRAGAER
jgi:CelD/BcsL family acetyltransferase involved in cellulose biosynthesis